MMNDLVARMLDLDSTSTLDAWTLSLSLGWPVAALVFLLVLAAVGAVLLYVREKSLRPSVRTILAVVRMLAVTVLLIMMFRPVIEATITRLRRSAVLVLVDGSDSMNIRDTRKEPAELVEAGVALGLLLGVAPELAENVLIARITAASSAEALQRGDRDAAEKQIAELDGELASVEQMATTLSPALDETILAELESLREQLSALTPELDSAADEQSAHAATLHTIADNLARWHEQVVVSQSPMDDGIHFTFHRMFLLLYLLRLSVYETFIHLR